MFLDTCRQKMAELEKKRDSLKETKTVTVKDESEDNASKHESEDEVRSAKAEEAPARQEAVVLEQEIFAMAAFPLETLLTAA